MRRLATQIHATVVAVLVLFAVLLGAAWWHGPGSREEARLAEAVAETAGEVLPGPERPAAELQVGPRAARPALRAGRGGLLARRASGWPGWGAAPAPRRGRAPPALDAQRTAGWSSRCACPDGRRLVASRPRPDWRHLGGRGDHGRPARARGRARRVAARAPADAAARDGCGSASTTSAGATSLPGRPVEGRDEVADLARSFNRAADRIQQLVEAERRQLAFASHELRSPLARLRVSLEMMAGDPALKAQAERDVEELDALIGELLEASRLEALGRPDRDEAVDLLGLVAEEAARVEAAVEGEAVEVRGDPRLLRRLVRNLLENARRHGGRRAGRGAGRARRDGARG